MEKRIKEIISLCGKVPSADPNPWNVINVAAMMRPFFFFSGFNQRRINFSISFFVVVIMDRIPKLERKIFPANQIRPIGAGSE